MSTPPAVKICGITTPDAFAAARDADWIGFVFFARSPRCVTPAEAAALALPGGPPAVGLFVDPTDDDVTAALDQVTLSALQVHAAPARAAALRDRFGLPVWRSVGVSAASDLPAALDGADLLLLDAKPPADATRPGGNATAFDWSVLHGWAAPGPWMLAGGLHPGNVAEALRQTGAPGVDVSSGVERARGVKDPARIRAFITAARGAATSSP